MAANLFQNPLLRWFIFLSISTIVLCAIFYPQPFRIVFGLPDTVSHIGAFIALALAARLVFAKYLPSVFWLTMFTIALLLEYLQGEILPLRSFSFSDLYSNVAGVAIAFVIFKLGKIMPLFRGGYSDQL